MLYKSVTISSVFAVKATISHVSKGMIFLVFAFKVTFLPYLAKLLVKSVDFLNIFYKSNILCLICLLHVC